MVVLAGTDPEDVIRNAFACFDEENTGKINEDRLRELLTTMGDRFTDAEVNVWLFCRGECLLPALPVLVNGSVELQ